MTENLFPAQNRIAAIIVSFNDASKLIRCVHSLVGQVSEIYVVDNGSGPESLAALEAFHSTVGFEWLANDRNLGLAAALNIGVKHAISRGFRWLLTLDQDSVVTDNMVSRLLEYALANPKAKSVSANLVSTNFDEKSDKHGLVNYAITSGNLVHSSVYEAVGFYDSSYFIDCIDFDFCLRVRRTGFEIHKVRGAELIHGVGDDKPYFGIIASLYTQHSPIRRYYMFRNYIFLLRTYLEFAPWFIIKLGIFNIILLLLIIIFDKQRFVNVRYILIGVRDGLFNRRGEFSRGL